MPDMKDNLEVRRNILVLAVAQTLGGSSGPIIISLGGLVGQELSTDPTLVTLPVSLYNLGLALGTLPAAFSCAVSGAGLDTSWEQPSALPER
jgi:hypothetical protein